MEYFLGISVTTVTPTWHMTR